MQITAVIVTYADRFNLLKQVISACFKNGVSNIVVVDNDSHKNSKNQLKALLEKNKDKISERNKIKIECNSNMTM